MTAAVESLLERINILEKRVQTLEFSIATVENILLEFLKEEEPNTEEKEIMKRKQKKTIISHFTE